ncbi:ligase-associated DNA damage response exonuclease [Pseudooceanicola onchidii]|uniref:ligase-associated DNA damage response exonuclease n=1 Tax=Pseudooceanicola onchidii TaxID=2562279 RepID=UPI0010A9A6BE|nr:ligase-associated DNA damage response exonuclease [Pseudooceanicola onchidii]
MRYDDMLHPTPQGLYCPPGDFYIDPVAPVPRALVTHGHADHARSGHGAVMATPQTLDIMALRYGAGFTRDRQPAGGDRVEVNGVGVVFRPAGHVLGSAQIGLEYKGMRITVSGDYCRHPNPACAPWEPIPADVFVTEATFALPVFRHPAPEEEMAKLMASLATFPDRAHLIGAYALGKAQRVIALIRAAGWDRPIYIHGALQALCDYHVDQGIDLGELRPATAERSKKADYAGEIVIAPPGALNGPWVRRFPDPILGFASGWMQIRNRAKARGVELPLIISDHVDWPDLTRTIQELAPQETWITHGREDALMRWCELTQRVGRPLRLVGYEDEVEE